MVVRAEKWEGQVLYVQTSTCGEEDKGSCQTCFMTAHFPGNQSNPVRGQLTHTRKALIPGTHAMPLNSVHQGPDLSMSSAEDKPCSNRNTTLGKSLQLFSFKLESSPLSSMSLSILTDICLGVS